MEINVLIDVINRPGAKGTKETKVQKHGKIVESANLSELEEMKLEIEKAEAVLQKEAAQFGTCKQELVARLVPFYFIETVL